MMMVQCCAGRRLLTPRVWQFNKYRCWLFNGGICKSVAATIAALLFNSCVRAVVWCHSVVNMLFSSSVYG